MNPFIILGSGSTVIKFVPPNPFSLQFWYFDLIFIITFAGIFWGVAEALGGEQEDGIMMAFLGTITGNFICYLMQIMNFGFMMLCIAGFLLYMWRAT